MTRNALRFVASLVVYAALSPWAAAVEPDIYEDDDTPAEATWLGIDDAPQIHGFDSPEDEDWLIFFVDTPVILTLETFDLTPSTDTLLTLFAPDGETPLPNGEDDNGGLDGNGASGLFYAFNESGFYYLRVTSATSDVGDSTAYSVRIRLEIGTIAGAATIVGFVADASNGQPLSGVEVKYGNAAKSKTNSTGLYVFESVPARTVTLTAQIAGFVSQNKTAFPSGGDVTQVDFELESDGIPPPSPRIGDVNGDSLVNAVDIQLVINAALGSGSVPAADVNEDGGVDAVDIQLAINAALGLL